MNALRFGNLDSIHVSIQYHTAKVGVRTRLEPPVDQRAVAVRCVSVAIPLCGTSRVCVRRPAGLFLPQKGPPIAVPSDSNVDGAESEVSVAVLCSQTLALFCG